MSPGSRRAAPAPVPDRRQRIAVMTMTRDEADMLPRWVDYYGRQLGTDNLFVIDDSSSDGSTDQLPCTVLHMPPAPWGATWMRTRTDLVNGLSRGLLACFDVVIFTDVDEFLVADPDRYADLPAYLKAKAGEDVLAPVAVNLLHHVALEPKFDPALPVLAQRRFVKFAPCMCKPLIKRITAPWMMGFHGIRAPFTLDPDLLLIHLKYYDSQALAGVAEARQELFVNQGRGAAASSWSLGAEEIQRQLAVWTATGAGQTVPELVPADLDVAGVVEPRDNGFFRSSGQPMEALAVNPLLMLPDRFRSAV